jgi:hypothetical protein
MKAYGRAEVELYAFQHRHEAGIAIGWTIESPEFESRRQEFSLPHVSTAALRLIEFPIQWVLFYIKDRTMDNVQNCDSYINITSSQTYRQH